MVSFKDSPLTPETIVGAVEKLTEHYNREGALCFAIYGPKGGKPPAAFPVGSFQRAAWINGFNNARRAAADAVAAQVVEQAEREALAEQQRQEEEEARYRYLPASYKALDKLSEAVGEAQAELVKDLIAAMIHEAMNPERD